jgi:hypothetical protein
MPTPSLREIPAPPELSPLQATLAQAEVVAEMSNPAGLRLDEPVVDPLTQYKADLRAELASHPQDLTTQLAAKGLVAGETVPALETYVPPPEPPPPIPTLSTIDPATAMALDGAQLSLAATGTGFLEGDFLAFGGTPVETTIVSGTEATCIIPPASVAGEIPVELVGASGTSNGIVFTYTEPPPPPQSDEPAPEGAITPAKAPEPETVTGKPIVEGA